MKGVLDLFPKDEEKGIARIVLRDLEYTNDVTNEETLTFPSEKGTYVFLYIGSDLAMTDTAAEKYTNVNFVNNAHGRVLIGGLGIGLIIKNIIDKEEVTEIIVIEKCQDVIDLVAPKFNSPKLKIICDDIMEWKPEQNEKFNVIYFDIWHIVQGDNVKEMKILHDKFEYFLDRTDENCWINSWLKEHLENALLKKQR